MELEKMTDDCKANERGWCNEEEDDLTLDVD